MPQYRIHFETQVMATVERVYSFLSDHQNFVSLFGDRCQRVREGMDEADGIGSVRRMGVGFLAFEETIVRFDRPQAIDYVISKGSPLKNHRGEIRLVPTQDGAATALDYRIEFDGKFPLIGALVVRLLKWKWKHSSPLALASLMTGSCNAAARSTV